MIQPASVLKIDGPEYGRERRGLGSGREESRSNARIGRKVGEGRIEGFCWMIQIAFPRIRGPVIRRRKRIGR